MSLNKTVLALALGTSLMALNVGVDARHHGRMYHEQSSEQHHMMMEKLGVSEEQRAHMDKLYQEHMEAAKAHREQMQELMKQQHSMMQQDTLDKAKLRSNLRKQADLKAEMMAGKHHHRQQMNKVLSEEQRAKMEAMKAQMYEKREEKREQAHERKQGDRG